MAYVFPKHTTDEYSFTVTPKQVGDRESVVIVLTQTSTAKTKVFELAGKHIVANLERHMMSLTDELCAQWFNVREPKKKEKKNAA